MTTIMAPRCTAFVVAPDLHLAGNELLPSDCAFATEAGDELAPNAVNERGWRPNAHGPGRYQCFFDGLKWVEAPAEGDDGQ